MLLCSVDRCGYCVEGICGRPLKSLNLSGACDYLYLPNGKVRQGFDVRKEDIELPVVSTAAIEVFEGDLEEKETEVDGEKTEN